MGTRVLDFSRTHPDASAGYTAALTRLEALLGRADELASRQRDGLLEVRAATSRKRELRRSMQQAHLAHLAQVAKVAAREDPDLAQKFVLKPGTTTYLAFRTAARGMAAEAQNHKELLEKHGLVDTVLDDLGRALDQFDAAVEHGTPGPAGTRWRERRAAGGGGRGSPDRLCDGRPQPLPVHAGRRAAGGVGERQQRAGRAAVGREARGGGAAALGRRGPAGGMRPGGAGGGALPPPMVATIGGGCVVGWARGARAAPCPGSGGLRATRRPFDRRRT